VLEIRFVLRTSDFVLYQPQAAHGPQAGGTE
jgi:hypothetical protein